MGNCAARSLYDDRIEGFWGWHPVRDPSSARAATWPAVQSSTITCHPACGGNRRPCELDYATGCAPQRFWSVEVCSAICQDGELRGWSICCSLPMKAVSGLAHLWQQTSSAAGGGAQAWGIVWCKAQAIAEGCGCAFSLDSFDALLGARHGRREIDFHAGRMLRATACQLPQALGRELPPAPYEAGCLPVSRRVWREYERTAADIARIAAHLRKQERAAGNMEPSVPRRLQLCPVPDFGLAAGDLARTRRNLIAS